MVFHGVSAFFCKCLLEEAGLSILIYIYSSILVPVHVVSNTCKPYLFIVVCPIKDGLENDDVSWCISFFFLQMSLRRSGLVNTHIISS